MSETISTGSSDVGFSGVAALIIGDHKIEVDVNVILGLGQNRQGLPDVVTQAQNELDSVNSSAAAWWRGPAYDAASDSLTAIATGGPAALSKLADQLHLQNQQTQQLADLVRGTKDQMDLIVLNALDQLGQLGISSTSGLGNLGPQGQSVISNAQHAVQKITDDLLLQIQGLESATQAAAHRFGGGQEAPAGESAAPRSAAAPTPSTDSSRLSFDDLQKFADNVGGKFETTKHPDGTSYSKITLKDGSLYTLKSTPKEDGTVGLVATDPKGKVFTGELGKDKVATLKAEDGSQATISKSDKGYETTLAEPAKNQSETTRTDTDFNKESQTVATYNAPGSQPGTSHEVTTLYNDHGQPIAQQVVDRNPDNTGIASWKDPSTGQIDHKQFGPGEYPKPPGSTLFAGEHPTNVVNPGTTSAGGTPGGTPSSTSTHTTSGTPAAEKATPSGGGTPSPAQAIGQGLGQMANAATQAASPLANIASDAANLAQQATSAAAPATGNLASGTASLAGADVKPLPGNITATNSGGMGGGAAGGGGVAVPERPLTQAPSPGGGTGPITPAAQPLAGNPQTGGTSAMGAGTAPMGAYPMSPQGAGGQTGAAGSRGVRGPGGVWQADPNYTGPGIIDPLGVTHPNQEAIDAIARLLRYVLDSDWAARENFPAGIRPTYAIAAHADPDEIVHYFFFTNQGRGWIPPGVVVPRAVQLGWETVPPIGRGVLLGRSDPGLQALRHYEAMAQHYVANQQRYRLIAIATSLQVSEQLGQGVLKANDAVTGDVALAAEVRFVDPSVTSGSSERTADITSPLAHRLQMVAPEAYRRISTLLTEKAQLAPLAVELAIDTVEASFAYDRPAFLDIVGALKRGEPITETMLQALDDDITAAVASAEIERSQQESKPLEDQKLVKYASDHTRISAGIALKALLEGDEDAVLDIAYEHYATNARPDKISTFINQLAPGGKSAETE